MVRTAASPKLRDNSFIEVISAKETARRLSGYLIMRRNNYE